MTSTNNSFELDIPTHIKFTLYKFDYIDNLIISNVLRECKNWNITENDVYTVHADAFKSAVLLNPKLKKIIDNIGSYDSLTNPDIKLNSLFFLWLIFDKLINLSWISFHISYDSNYTRLIKTNNTEIISFYFKIEEGVFDLTKMFDRTVLDTINKKLIKTGVLRNEYLNRLSYFYIKASTLLNTLSELSLNNNNSIADVLNDLDSKLEEDDPILLVITDYTSY